MSANWTIYHDPGVVDLTYSSLQLISLPPSIRPTLFKFDLLELLS